MLFSYNTQFISIRNILTHACLYINSTSSPSNPSRIFIISTVGISLWNISTSNFVCGLIISQITFIHNLILINLKVLTNLTFGSDLLFFKLFRYLSLLIIFWGCVIILLLPEACTFETLADCRLTGLIHLISLFIQNHWVIYQIIFFTVFLIYMISLRRWILFSLRFGLFFFLVHLLIGNNI